MHYIGLVMPLSIIIISFLLYSLSAMEVKYIHPFNVMTYISLTVMLIFQNGNFIYKRIYDRMLANRQRLVPLVVERKQVNQRKIVNLHQKLAAVHNQLLNRTRTARTLHEICHICARLCVYI